MATVKLKNMKDGKIKEFQAVDAREILANENNDFVIVGRAPKSVQPSTQEPEATVNLAEDEINFWQHSLPELKAFADDANIAGFLRMGKKAIIGKLEAMKYNPQSNNTKTKGKTKDE